MDERSLLAEGLGSSALDFFGAAGPPIDIVELARAHGLAVVAGEVPMLLGSTIVYESRLDASRQRSRIAHELGHELARRSGEDDRDEKLAWAIGAAVLIPSKLLKRDVADRCWDLATLPALYGVSWEMLVRRLCHVLGCVVSVWDEGRLTRRWRSPWLLSRGWHQRSVPEWELHLAAECAIDEWHVYETDGVAAYYVPSPGWHRVVVVSEVDCWEAMSRPAPWG